MKVITKRTLIREIAKKWNAQFFYGPLEGDTTGDKLSALDVETASVEDIVQIIGTTVWTDLSCSECGKSVDLVIQVGEEPDWETQTAYLCEACVKNTFNLLNENI